MLRQHARAGDGYGPVDGREQRAAPLARQRADQLEIGARRGIDLQRRPGGLARGRGERRAFADLRALHVGDAGGGRGQLQPREGAERLGGRHREIVGEPPLGGRPVEHVARKRRDRRQRAKVGRKLGVAVERVGDDDLARLEPGDLGRKGGAVAFGEAEFAGRDVDPGEREQARFGRGARARDCREVIVAPCIEQAVLGERAGGDQAHDVAPHHALSPALPRLGRVLQLLAHGDAVAERDQPVQVLVGALDRHATHRDIAAEMLAALGEHDAERARGNLRVVEEQFVEVAHPVEQEVLRIGRLDLDVLLHHRGDAGSVAVAARHGAAAPVRWGGHLRGCGRAGGVHGRDASRWWARFHGWGRGCTPLRSRPNKPRTDSTRTSQ